MVIRPEGMEGLTGVVRWINGNQAGVEFDNPLYAPIVDHLSAQYADGKEIEVAAAADESPAETEAQTETEAGSGQLRFLL